MGLGQHRHERGRRDGLDAMVLPDRLAPKSHRQMCLARTRRPKEQDRVAMSNPAACQNCRIPRQVSSTSFKGCINSNNPGNRSNKAAASRFRFTAAAVR